MKNFCAIAEAGGIARIAGGDPAKQSLYSRQVRELEQFFGVELTRRKGKGIEITEQGRELARQVRAHLQSLTDFKKACAGQPIEFRIASGNSVVEWLVVPNICQDHRGSAIGAFFLSEHAHRGGCKGLEGAQHRLWYSAKVSCRRAVEISLDWPNRLRAVCAGGMGEGEGGCDDVIETTARWQYPAGGEFNKRFQECCEKAKLTPNLRFSCASFTQVAELVRTGHAVALLPEMAEPNLRASGVRRFDFAPMRTYRREIGIVWHPRLVSIRPQAESVLAGLKQIEA